MNFTDKHKNQIQTHGLQLTQVENQLRQFAAGMPYTKVLAAATLGNGIDVIEKSKQTQLAAYYENKKDTLDIVKFVPASGAATRMFKVLYTFLDTDDFSDVIKKISTHVQKLPFASTLIKEVKVKYPNIDSFSQKERTKAIIDTLLSDEGLGFGKLPKGLIPFHRYQHHSATAFEEQLVEASFYTASRGVCTLHFTVSKNHLEKFQEEFRAIQNRIEQKTSCKFEVSYSFQKPETDTVAVHTNNSLFEDNGQLVFRPSGHGALIENLNDIDADIIFIKNIDNVVIENTVAQMALHKKVLAGKLLQIQEKVFSFLHDLTSDRISPNVLDDIKEFIVTELHLQNVPETKEALQAFLDRPIRICGMVKNTGAPGGGPFWVIDKNGIPSKQIVELSQIDTTNPNQQKIVEKATHFNPVDLVCGVKNYKGKKFDLTQYVDPDAGFLSEKSINGTPIKALELPGLWNGAMADWMTIFVEVPLYTFNPVKTVLDLLKESHQSPKDES